MSGDVNCENEINTKKESAEDFENEQRKFVMTRKENKNLESACMIMLHNQELSTRSSSNRKNWAEGFHNGIIFNERKLNKKLDELIEIYHDDFINTHDQRSQGKVVILNELKKYLEIN